MPTWDTVESFERDLRKLTPKQRQQFRTAVSKFVLDLKQKRLRKGLRVKRVRGETGVWELTWANDGRATFQYGDQLQTDDPHIIWRRIGGHDIFDRP
jgi:hypothetical protein